MNRKIICSTLLALILLLSTTAIVYYNLKTGNNNVEYYNNDDKSQVNDESKDSNVENENSVISTENIATTETVDNLILLTSFEEFNSYISREKTTFLVLGRANCPHCQNYKPVLENIAQNYKVEILYIDMDAVSSDFITKVRNSNLTIPAACTSTNEVLPLSSSFGTPLTLFIKNGQAFSCLRGDTSEETVLQTIKNIGLI